VARFAATIAPVAVTLPLSAITRGLIGSREPDWMKPDAILVNVARGPIVDGRFELGLGRAAENVRRYLLGEPFVGLVRREDHAG